MPLSYLRRPLFLCLAVYVSILICLRTLGFFDVPCPPELWHCPHLEGARLNGRIVSPLKEDFRGQKLFLSAQSLDGRPFAYRLLAYLPRNRDWTFLRPGMPVEISGRLRAPRSPRNPGEFDERAFLADRGASCVMNADALRVLGSVPGPWLIKAWAEGARQSLERFLRSNLPEDEAHVYCGLTLGFKGALRRDWNRAIQDAGATHLIVPSGAKVAVIMLAVAFLTTKLGISPVPRLFLTVLFGGFYTFMVGADAPYTRAFWGGSALGICLLSGRESGAFQATTLAALLTLLWDPRELFSAGFQMTYAAVLGLVLAMPSLQTATAAWPRWAGRLACLIAVSAIVQAMLWPIFANTFGRGSLIAVLANLVLVPASGLLMAAGFGCWMLGHGGGPLAWLARLFVGACRAFASLPHAAVDLSPMSPRAVIVYYLAVAALLLLPRRKASAAAAAAGLLVWAGGAAAARCRAPAASVLLLRLPPAHPALVSFSDGRRFLIDPGTKISALTKALQSRGISRLDRLILTGPWPQRAEEKLRRKFSWREQVSVAPPWRFCQGRVCFELGGPAMPRVLRGKVQFSIIAKRLKAGAVEVTTDGGRAEIRSPCPPRRPNWSAPWSPSTTRPSRRPAA